MTHSNESTLQPRSAVDTPPPSRSESAPARGATMYIVGAVIVLAVGGGGFAAGYGVGHGTSTTGTNGGFGSMSGGSFGMRRGGFGTVTSVSSTSITIEETGPGGAASQSGTSSTASTKTYTITSSTTVTSDGSTASVSDIKTGDTVRIRTSSTTNTDATEIEINPTMMGGPGGQTQSSDGSDTTVTTT